MEKTGVLIDAVFKLGLLAVLAGLLWVYAQSRDNGRYQYITDGRLEFILDTRTGALFQDGFSMNHVTGKER